MTKVKSVFTKVVDANIQNEYANDFDHARIEIDFKGAKRILHLADVVKREKVSYIHEYDYSPVFLQTDWGSEDEGLKEVDARVDCEQVVVCNDSFWWEGELKNSNISWSTDRITIKELCKHFGLEDE